MLGVHPRTGKEVRVIQTDASVWRENKTLFYSEDKCIWDTVHDGDTKPTYRILLNVDSAEALKEASKNSKLLLIAKAALDSVDNAALKTLGINNLICLEEIHLMYPHLGPVWDGTAADGAVLMAGLLRYRRLAGIWNERAAALKLVQEDKPPAKLWWITQFFKHGKSDRASEIRKCLRENVSSRLIDKILLLNESPQTFTKTDKIQEEVIGHRLTYQDVFERIYDIPDNTIVVFANADIFIDDSFKELWHLNLEDKFLALLRYDLPNSGDLADAKIFGPRADSQDTWIVRSDDIKKRDRSVWEKMDFQFGKMGCDNGLALEMMRAKFLVVNPAQTIKTYHVHSSEIRNYSKTDVVDMPVFHYIQPSGVHDLMPEFKLSTGTSAPAVLKNVLRGSEDAVKAWKESIKVPFELVVQPPVPQLIDVSKPCFQTTEGLVFDAAKMYIGETDAAKLLWNNSKIHGLMPTLEVGRAFAIPWPLGAEKSREVYCLRYISKVFRLWAQGRGEFFGSEDPGFEEVLQIFNWNAETLPIVAREDNSLMWCKEGAVGFVHDAGPVLKEDMEALRSYLRGWLPTVSDKKLIIMEDGIVLTKEIVLDLETKLEVAGFDVRIVYPRKTSLERTVDIYTGAWGIICACGVSAVGWNWILPEGANVFEVNSSKVLGLEISTAAGLTHWFVKKDGIVDQVLNTLGSTVVDVNLPTIYVPAATEGFFSHPGDSFREMVRLWQKAGYVNVCEHPGTQVWWGAVGAEGVLLYDRPTNEWRLAAPVEEREWKLALFGNPKVGSTEKAVPWTFWPRRPTLVEDVNLKSWDDRVGVVFYGKCENLIQERRRKGDWESVCEEWIMVKGDEPHSLTQSEYLERLAGARFGLCLPGYGFKCHREIECMAMGCVPIVSKGVDMDSYAVPPLVGVHYLRVEEPEDVAAAIAPIDRAGWEAMSAACRDWWMANASVAGSFKLTAKLIEGSADTVADVEASAVAEAVSEAGVVGETDLSGAVVEAEAN